MPAHRTPSGSIGNYAITASETFCFLLKGNVSPCQKAVNLIVLTNNWIVCYNYDDLINILLYVLIM